MKKIYTSSDLTEHQIQACVMEWAEGQLIQHPELKMLYAIPNGGARNAVTGALLKAEGVKRGVPDLCLPVARGKYHGLYIEMKRATGKPTQAQIQWLYDLKDQGYATAISHDAALTADLILRYLDGEAVGE